jgi:hypothetical protein
MSPLPSTVTEDDNNANNIRKNQTKNAPVVIGGPLNVNGSKTN